LKLGVSVYSVEEIEFVLKNYDIDIIQIPMNVFDQRLLQSGMLKKLKNSGVEVHVRSAFLQGIVFMDPQELPHNLVKHAAYLSKFVSLTKELGVSPVTACLAFLMQQPEINKVICGVNSMLQLQQLIQTVSSLPLISKSVFDAIAVDDNNFLNPSNW
jgi:aryl-alcohol dehydrogenase-like predicted oxidoreductase